MRELFGIPVGTLALVLVGALALVVALVAALALRNRVFFRLGVRNVPRRPGRSALIVAGLMLGTAIIAAALATGDTMSHTIRASAIASLGETDQIVSVRGADVEAAGDPAGAGAGAPVAYFPEEHYAELAAAVEGSPLVEGITPAITEPVAVQNVAARRNEPRVTLFAAPPDRLAGFAPITAVDGGAAVSLADLGPGEIYLTREAAETLAAGPGDDVRLLAGERVADARVRAVVEFDGTGADGPALLVPLARAQELLGREGLIRHVLVSNAGGPVSGAEATDEVTALLAPAAEPLGLEVTPAKRDALEAADEMGSAFMSFFTTFGTFSIAAGILLIFLIFVMLAAERRAELGIARAVGTRRGHLVQMFVFEGFALALAAAAVGALVGIAVAYGMVLVMAGAFGATEEFDIAYSVTLRSVVVAYAIGVLLTFAVVAVSAWRVSRMNIVTAIRNLPEPPVERKRRRRWLPGALGLAAGAALAVSGARGSDAVTLGLGVSLVILGLAGLARAGGVSERVARTAAGLALVVWFLLPADLFLAEPRMNFSIFILAGLMIVIGATWVIMYNAEALLGALTWPLARVRALAPVIKMAMAYPLRNLFRTGVTLAMFTLVVFTLVVGATTSGAFTQAFNDLDAFGGGFDVRATTSPGSPVGDVEAALARAEGVDPAAVAVAASQSVLPIEARQEGTAAQPASYVARGLDDAFLEHTTYTLGAKAAGYATDEEVWQALREEPGLAVVDPTIVPRRGEFMFGVMQELRLEGFYVEDESFAPVEVAVRDPQSGEELRVTVIGVLSDIVPLDMAGISTSQEALARAFGDRAAPTVHYFALREGAHASAAADRLESGFLAHGMQAHALEEVLADQMSASLTFNRLVQGFMGLGLVVGVAALGVITARSVVERRQQIGVLRAIGFRRRMVQLSFLLESSFVALTAILIGTALGLAVAFNVIRDSAGEPSWQNLSFVVPWVNLTVIFLVVYAVALATTFAPALRASRVYPAEALRYE